MDGHSRTVSILRLLLPLLALVLLSTLFLFSRNSDPADSIPFAQREIDDRLSGEQITEPFFSGTTTAGDRVILTANRLQTAGDQGNRVESISVRFDLTSGTWITLMSDQGTYASDRFVAELSGNVVISTSSQFEMRTERLTAGLDELSLTAPQTTVTGPLGRFEAGQMQLESGQTPHFLFTQGVKLVYDPKPEVSE